MNQIINFLNDNPMLSIFIFCMAMSALFFMLSISRYKDDKSWAEREAERFRENHKQASDE